MSRFDLYPTARGRDYLIDLQSDLLDLSSTRMMAPMVPAESVPDSLRQLHPRIELDDAQYVMVTHLLGAVPKSILREPITNLSDQAEEFTRALDFLFQGY